MRRAGRLRAWAVLLPRTPLVCLSPFCACARAIAGLRICGSSRQASSCVAGQARKISFAHFRALDSLGEASGQHRWGPANACGAPHAARAALCCPPPCARAGSQGSLQASCTPCPPPLHHRHLRRRAQVCHLRCVLARAELLAPGLWACRAAACLGTDVGYFLGFIIKQFLLAGCSPGCLCMASFFAGGQLLTTGSRHKPH